MRDCFFYDRGFRFPVQIMRFVRTLDLMVGSRMMEKLTMCVWLAIWRPLLGARDSILSRGAGMPIAIPAVKIVAGDWREQRLVR